MKYAKEWAQVQEIIEKVKPFLPETHKDAYDPAVFNYETFERDVEIGISNGFDIAFQIQLFNTLNDVVIKAKQNQIDKEANN